MAAIPIGQRGLVLDLVLDLVMDLVHVVGWLCNSMCRCICSVVTALHLVLDLVLDLGQVVAMVVRWWCFARWLCWHQTHDCRCVAMVMGWWCFARWLLIHLACVGNLVVLVDVVVELARCHWNWYLSSSWNHVRNVGTGAWSQMRSLCHHCRYMGGGERATTVAVIAPWTWKKSG